MTQINPDGKPVIFLTGQSGMLGQQITQSMADKYYIHGLQRKGSSANNPSWNYRESLAELNIKAPEILIHLAGAGIADKRWTKKYKKTIYDSRIYGTRWLVDEVKLYEQQPHTFICASAIGYYGNRPNERLYESSEPGDNFVAQIATNWEYASQGLQDSETRLINLRFGMILSQTGGALKDMLLPFKLGLGGKLGNGQQQYSWISIQDTINAIDYLINQTDCDGNYNLTSPNPVSNQTFTQTLAQALKRPAFMHMPAFLVRLVFGEIADELLLADARVYPQRLIDQGFKFEHPDLDQALQSILS
jgi:uncharacterized protein (TIGR01777 family)